MLRCLTWKTARSGQNKESSLQEVRRIAADNWTGYVSPRPEPSKVHLLPYPVMVERQGRVSALARPHHTFPDTTASVLGTKSGFLPAKLTT